MFFDLLIVSLAAYRLSYLVCFEAGPFNLATRLRTAVFNWAEGRESRKWAWEGINCYYCVSFWCSMLMGALAYVFSPLPNPASGSVVHVILFACGCAGGSMFIYKVGR